MKLEKVYAEIIKAKLKERKIHMGILDEEYYGVTLDGILMYFLPRSECLLNLDTLLRNNELKDFSKLRPTRDVKLAEKSNTLTKKLDKLGKMCTLAQIGDKYVNEALLKNFDNPTFGYADGGYSNPVYVYENNNNLVGLVCPFIVND